MIGVEYQGLLPTIRLWAPKIWKDLYDPWRAALAMLLAQANPSDLQWQREASREIVRACFGLMGHSALVQVLLDTLEGQLAFPGADHEALVKALLHFERFPLAKPTPATKRRLAKLLGAFSNGPYERRFARFVEYETYDEDHTVSKSGAHEVSPLPAKRVECLAREMLSSPEIAANCLDRAIQSRGFRIRIFGHHIGKLADPGFCALAIQRAKSSGSAGGIRFIAGLLDGAREANPVDADALALDLLAGRGPADWHIAATVASGVTMALMPKLVKFAKTASPGLFEHVGYQANQGALPPNEVEALLHSLLRNKSITAANVALDIGYYWFGKSSGPQCTERLHWKLVTDHRLFGDNMRRSSHAWETMAKAFRKRFPSREVDLLAALLNPRKKQQSYVAASETFGVLGAICAAKPDQSWGIVAAALEGKSHVWTVSHWLGGGMRDDASPTPIEAFSAERIFKWIDESPRERLARVLDFIPKTLASPGGDLTAAFIERYGSAKGFNDSLAFRFGLGSYSGPSSEHHAAQREQAIKWAGATASTKVKVFLDAYIGALTKLIELERMHEERS